MKNRLLLGSGLTVLVLMLAACAQVVIPPATIKTPEVKNTTEETPAQEPLTTQTDKSSASLLIEPSTEQTQATTQTSENIKVTSPAKGEVVSSPLKISGTARNWYFEGTFPVRIEDENGNVLVSGQAHALQEWTKGGWIDFEANLEFDPGTALKGKIVLQNDNPSGLPENSESQVVEVKFK